MADKVPMLRVNANALNQVSEALKKFPEKTGSVVARVLWGTRDFVKSEIVRQVPRVYDTTQTQVRGALSAARKRFVGIRQVGENTVAFEVRGKRINLARFHHSPSAPPSSGAGNGKRKLKHRGYQAKVAVFREGGMKNINAIGGADGKRKPVFLAGTGAKGGDGQAKIPFIFFSRTGRPAAKNPKREAIVPRYSVAIPQMVVNPKVSAPLVNAITEKLQKETVRQVEREAAKELYGEYRGGK